MTVETHASFDDLREEWDSLADRSGATPFQRPGWFEAWWPAFGVGELQLLTIRGGGTLTGVLPLARRRGRVGSLTNWHTAINGGVYADREAAEALSEALVSSRPAQARLRFLDPDDPFVETFLAYGERRGASTLRRVMHQSPYVPIEGSWEDYERSLPKDRRRSIRRRERRLREMGELEIEVRDGSEKLDALLEEGFALEAAGWKGTKGTAILSDERTRGFYTDLCRWAAAAGLLRLVFVRLDGRPIAFNLCLEDGRAHYALKPGHDPELANYGPGALLMLRMVERSFSLGLERHELLGKSDEFKRSFAGDNAHERLELQAFSSTPRGAALRVVEGRLRPVARRLLAARR
jgi:CelD/BcsL family acetyltransferase involved in cellulose biosynthesis